MIDRIAGLKIDISPKPTPRSNNSQANFMNVLRDKFDEMTDKLNKVPGLPGVYEVNSPTVDFVNNINITEASNKTLV